VPSPSATFAIAVDRVLASEGGYVNDPHDPGGETKYGISKRAYPTVNIATLTEDDARAIYHRDYWQPVRGDELPAPVALVLFDAAVNQGVKTAIRFLQSALKVAEDGVLGPQTLLQARAERDSVYLASRVLRRRIEAYSTLDGWPRYRASWVQRCFDIFRVACQVAT